MTLLTFDGLGLAEPLRRALQAENYLMPTPIQVRAIPQLLEGKDMLGIAQTGTGKTAAFVLPILHRLMDQPRELTPRSARVLVLAPTRELALQIAERTRAYGRHLHLRQAVVLGGVNQNQQVRALVQGVDILIATPGRLLDLYNQRHVRLDKVSVLVLDEADRMLDMGFIRDVRKIVAAAPKERQTLLFSATIPQDIARLAAEILRSPVRVDVSPTTLTADKIDQRVFLVHAAAKRALLSELLADPAMARVLVFTRTKHGANRVTEGLSRSGVAVEAIHGNKSQNARQRALEMFRKGKTRVLVATDIAARGIDVAGITHVVNFELPNIPESYVHRIGRTARAGAGGIAISFCDPGERAFLRDIEKLTQSTITVAENRLGRETPAQDSRSPAKPHGSHHRNRGRHHGGRSRHAASASTAPRRGTVSAG